MDSQILENFTLPALFTGMREVLKYNHRVIKSIAWKSRYRNNWYGMSSTPAQGCYPICFLISLEMPMYVSPYEIDHEWDATLEVTFPLEFFHNMDSYIVKVIPNFSNGPFTMYASGKGQNSYICIGDLGVAARHAKPCNIIPLICAMLNRDILACSRNETGEAFEHWKMHGFRPINQIVFYGADGNPLTGKIEQQERIRFQKL